MAATANRKDADKNAGAPARPTGIASHVEPQIRQSIANAALCFELVAIGPWITPSRKALGPSMAMFIGRAAPVHPPIPMTGQTMSEKVLARASHTESVSPGQIVDGDVDLLYMHEMLAMALLPFNETSTIKFWDTKKIVVTLYHWVTRPTPER